jgi:hypothetical protein
MAHFHTANRASYQTYARPLAGGKRKRISTSNDIEPVSYYQVHLLLLSLVLMPMLRLRAM